MAFGIFFGVWCFLRRSTWRAGRLPERSAFLRRSPSFEPLASCLPQSYRKDCIADYHVLFALAYWRAYCIGILFDLARARLYIISIKMPVVAHRLPYLLGSGILDHTLLMADAYYNKYENLHTRDDPIRELDDHNRNRIYNTHKPFL